ncbi:MAG: hypothetical protein J6V50_02250 [Clostridia bacterium]|nr:hypothetical protein [Clostridia bacterium]
MEDKKENLISAVRLWALSEGMEKLSDEQNYECQTDVAFKKNDKIYGFITEIERAENEIKDVITKAESACDYLYVVTNDNARRRELIKIIPSYCGILCYGDSFGLGHLYQVLKDAKKV